MINMKSALLLSFALLAFSMTHASEVPAHKKTKNTEKEAQVARDLKPKELVYKRPLNLNSKNNKNIEIKNSHNTKVKVLPQAKILYKEELKLNK